jgi:hypothetical protein
MSGTILALAWQEVVAVGEPTLVHTNVKQLHSNHRLGGIQVSDFFFLYICSHVEDGISLIRKARTEDSTAIRLANSSGSMSPRSS